MSCDWRSYGFAFFKKKWSTQISEDVIAFGARKSRDNGLAPAK